MWPRRLRVCACIGLAFAATCDPTKTEPPKKDGANKYKPPDWAPGRAAAGHCRAESHDQGWRPACFFALLDAVRRLLSQSPCVSGVHPPFVLSLPCSIFFISVQSISLLSYPHLALRACLHACVSAVGLTWHYNCENGKNTSKRMKSASTTLCNRHSSFFVVVLRFWEKKII